MKINTPHGTMNLDDDAIPSIEDKNDIIASVTKKDDNGAEFQALCDASTKFQNEKRLTNAEFLAACNDWLIPFRRNPMRTYGKQR